MTVCMTLAERRKLEETAVKNPYGNEETGEPASILEQPDTVIDLAADKEPEAYDHSASQNLIRSTILPNHKASIAFGPTPISSGNLLYYREIMKYPAGAVKAAS